MLVREFTVFISAGDCMDPETELLTRITIDPKIFGGKPIIRGHRLAVEHVLGMLAAGDTPESILKGLRLARTSGHSRVPALRAPRCRSRAVEPALTNC